VPAGLELKAIRNDRHITIREVELESRRIAEAKGDKRYSISNAWLTRLESGVSEPSIRTFFSLSAIYRVRITELMRLYEVNVDDIEKFETIATPHLTQLLPAEVQEDDRTTRSLKSLEGLSLYRTTILRRTVQAASRRPVALIRNSDTRRIILGYLGLSDFTMYPMIRPGSFVRIDTRQKKLLLVGWRNEYERPIYFVELRDAYACGWCELQGHHLLIIPHQSSPDSIRRFAYPREAEIIGRVTDFDTPCVDEKFVESESAKQQKQLKVKHA